MQPATTLMAPSGIPFHITPHCRAVRGYCGLNVHHRSFWDGNVINAQLGSVNLPVCMQGGLTLSEECIFPSDPDRAEQTEDFTDERTRLVCHHFRLTEGMRKTIKECATMQGQQLLQFLFENGDKSLLLHNSQTFSSQPPHHIILPT